MTDTKRVILIAALLTAVAIIAASTFDNNVESQGANDADLHNLLVELPNGKLRGKDNGYYYSYESIPYAEAPVGELRFEAPIAYNRKWQGVHDATKPPVTCMQWDQFRDGDDKLSGNEDCLTVNVYKPKVVHASKFEARKKFPVLVFIHGGCFMFGSVRFGSVGQVMRDGHMMVVKMSYRVGPLGFLSTEDSIIPGNFGLKDQRLALQWIKQNIAHFGGDPEQILMLGFSAGGSAVHLHMLRSDFSNYAKVAASISGTALNPWVIVHNARTRAFELAKHLNCTYVENSADIKKCLKAQTAETIVTAVRYFLIFGYNPFTTFGPVVEAADAPYAFLTQTPEQLIRAGQFAKLPWLVSYTAQDGGYNAAELLQRIPHGNELIEVLNKHWFQLAPHLLFFKDTMSTVQELEHASRLKERYMGKNNFSLNTYPQLQEMYTDILFKNSVEQAVRLHRAADGPAQSVYAYVYDNPAQTGVGNLLANRSDVKLGTIHGDDLFAIFDYPDRNQRADELVISQKFITMFADFVKNSHELRFGSCLFDANIDGKQLGLMFIRRNTCGSIKVSSFP